MMNLAAFAAYCILSATYPSGQVQQERWPAVSIEAGIERGKARAAQWWGEMPGSGFDLTCYDANGHSYGSSPAEPGHAGLHWEWK